MTKRYAVVLAAGQGTRMKSKLYKVLHPVMGRPMVQHVVNQLKELRLESIVTVVGFGAEKVQEQLGNDSNYVIQEQQLGTGHAVVQTKEYLQGKEGTTIVVCGDTPLLTKETLEALLDHHDKEEAKVTVLTANAPNPSGYGRVIRNDKGDVERIVEHKDANPAELLISEINTGTYCFDNQQLFHALSQVSNNNSQGEYYLPDVIEILKQSNQKISAFQTENFDETLGVNDRVALSQAEKYMKKRINEMHMKNGVTIIDPDYTYIGPDVTIEQDVVIHPGCVINGDTMIKPDSVIGPHTEITDCKIGTATVIRQSVAINSEIGDRVQIGPYAHIRPEATIGDEVKIGNFVEIKKSKLQSNSKVSHLSYIGDAEVGKNVNIGCGTITVNYDGKKKHLTKIEDDAFIGCNSNLIAPVTVGKGAYVAAGSTINKNVPNDALSIARARQENKEEYVSKIKSQINKD
ncbi:bifunctional UDP-N-acetylglucosamine diphosphorylase/glucosamine-1-phosphate N-acetyltransferase GlmU [Aquibacillus rhizosphaerae]|uniref:Bifunctional protein GlmU n=1 Tax=Aquibacillus rhizosphaerae TaxID=3051431 RepID=A0ABT7L5J6_9BACI|nr:bifunctional UDP-N-acetylglucosamine diphosphorylase/glucosamine-1-phosphate N-acetyltransferase GlmU [Aquibacillus sp. LR5S19]MDL4840470.1 bifunctional UDP-N-acetylglucosamine diphosphorylase/glucosamine-1-phosphate N-acetyltransferase GlmU [Aquibacillus sp. LR5S19]